MTQNSVQSFPNSKDITRVTLPNGITVLARANFNSPSVIFNGFLPAGGLFDPDEKLGLADFTASAMMRGTANYSFQQIYEAMESVGANLGISGGTHTTSFHGRSLVEDLEMLLHLIANILRTPSFPPEQVERLRAQLLTGLAIRSQDTNEMASLAFDQVVYAGHPYSRPEDGFIETVQAIGREDLVAFHARHFGPKGLVIAFAGAIEPATAVDKVAEVLGDWQNPNQPEPPELPPVVALKHPVVKKVSIAGKSQADIIVGAAGPSRSNPDYLAASLGNNILGQFGMMGRIGDVVRERSGLAYYAESSLGGGIGPGPWYVSAGANPANVDRIVELIHQEITRFVSEPVSEEELADSQANYIGRLPLSLESNAGVTAALINLQRYERDLDYFLHFPELVRSVTREEILETARRYLVPEGLGTAIAGP